MRKEVYTVIKDTMILFFVLVTMGFLVSMGSASNFNLTTNITETDIIFNFDDEITYTIQFDNTTITNYEENFYFANNLEPNTRHYFKLTSGLISDELWVSTDKAFYQTTFFFILTGAFILLIASIGISLLAFGSFALGFPLLFETLTTYRSDEYFVYYLVVTLIIFIVSGFRAWAKYEG